MTESEVTTSPVFNSLEEAQAWQQSQQTQTTTTEEVVEKNIPTPEPPKTAEGGVEVKAAETPTFDETTYLKGIFGEEFSNVDAIKAKLTQKAETIDPELIPFIEEAKFLKSNPQAMELAKYATKEGADVPLMWSLTKLDVQKLEPKDALVLDLVFNKGLSKDVAEAMVQRNHAIALGGDDYDPSEKLAASGELQLQSVDARNRLADLQTKIRLPEPERKALEEKQGAEQNEASRIAAWKPEVQKLAETVEFAYSKEHGEGDLKTPIAFSMKLDESGKKQYTQIVEGIVSNPNFQMTPENKNYVKQLADAIYFAQNREAILNNFANKVMESRDEVYGKKYYGVPPKAETHTDGNNGHAGKVVVQDTRQNANYGKW